MTILYGRGGKPAGSSDGAAIYDREGDQIGLLDADYIYSADSGEWVGSMTSGVVYNAFGDPVGFAKKCSGAVPLLPPKNRSILPPKLKSFGPDVRNERLEEVPSFLSHMSSIPPRHAAAGFFL
jgi:hypothetical protein